MENSQTVQNKQKEQIFKLTNDLEAQKVKSKEQTLKATKEYEKIIENLKSKLAGSEETENLKKLLEEEKYVNKEYENEIGNLNQEIEKLNEEVKKVEEGKK